MIYVKENQYTEEEILDNNENSPLFEEFLQVLGEKVRLKGIGSHPRIHLLLIVTNKLTKNKV